MPDSPGVPADRLLEGSRLPLAAAAKAALADDMVATGALKRSGAALRLADHQSDLNAADQALWERMRGQIEAAGLRPPGVAEIATALKQPPKRVKDLLVRVAKQQQAWRVSEDRFALPATVRAWAAHATALAGPDGQGRFGAVDFRDRSGVGRNLAIEILEFFDRVKLTRRIGDVRLLQGAPDTLFGNAARG
jgi:selenocysteine-specific elongation factor